MRTIAIREQEAARFLGGAEFEKMTANEKTAQVVIAISSCVTIFFLSHLGNIELAKWGFLTGLVGQPFWLVSTVRKSQWGMFAVSVFYTWQFLDGVMRFWM